MVYLCKWDKILRTLIYFKCGSPLFVIWTSHRAGAVTFVDEQHALDAALANHIHDFMLLVQEVK